jgi:hypothetical protein
MSAITSLSNGASSSNRPRKRRKAKASPRKARPPTSSPSSSARSSPAPTSTPSCTPTTPSSNAPATPSADDSTPEPHERDRTSERRTSTRVSIASGMASGSARAARTRSCRRAPGRWRRCARARILRCAPGARVRRPRRTRLPARTCVPPAAPVLDLMERERPARDGHLHRPGVAVPAERTARLDRDRRGQHVLRAVGSKLNADALGADVLTDRRVGQRLDDDARLMLRVAARPMRAVARRQRRGANPRQGDDADQTRRDASLHRDLLAGVADAGTKPRRRLNRRLRPVPPSSRSGTGERRQGRTPDVPGAPAEQCDAG